MGKPGQNILEVEAWMDFIRSAGGPKAGNPFTDPGHDASEQVILEWN